MNFTIKYGKYSSLDDEVMMYLSDPSVKSVTNEWIKKITSASCTSEYILLRKEHAETEVIWLSCEHWQAQQGMC